MTDTVGNPWSATETVLRRPVYADVFVDLLDGFNHRESWHKHLGDSTALTLTKDLLAAGIISLGVLVRSIRRTWRWSDPDYWRFEAQAGDRVAICIDTPGSDLDSSWSCGTRAMAA